MKKFLLSALLALCPLFGYSQATTGFHRVNQVIARGNYGVTAQVVPYAVVSVTDTVTGSAATIYSDPLLTAQIVPSVVTADASGNYDYYIPLQYCVDETVSSPGAGSFTTPNICVNASTTTGIINTGTTGQFPYYASSGTILSPLSPAAALLGLQGISSVLTSPQTMVGPLSTSTVGVFTNTTQTAVVQGLVNGASPSMMVAGGPGTKFQDGVLGAVIVPNTSAKWQADGLNGMVDNYSNGAPGSGGTAGVGVYGQARGYGASSYNWGSNLVCILESTASTSAVCTGQEIDMDYLPTNNSGTVIGQNVSAMTWMSQPAYSAAYVTNGEPGAKWDVAFTSNSGAAANALIANPTATANNSPSQPIVMKAFDSTGSFRNTTIQADINGNLVLTPYTGEKVSVVGNFSLSGSVLGNLAVTGQVSSAYYDGSINPFWQSIGSNGVGFQPATNGGSPNELYGVNAANTAYNWKISDAGAATFANYYNANGLLLPSTLTGYHGTTGTKVQVSDSTGTSGPAFFDANGNTTATPVYGKLLANCGTMTTTAAANDSLSCAWVTTSSNCTITQSNSTVVAWTYYTPTAGSVEVFHAATPSATYAIACSQN